jgi:hypothetical protein
MDNIVNNTSGRAIRYEAVDKSRRKACKNNSKIPLSEGVGILSKK